MKNFINYIKESKISWKKQVEDRYIEYEKLFLELTHLDELEIKFDFIEYENYLFHFYNESELFLQDKKNGWFYMNYTKIWSIFGSKYNLKYDDIQSITKDIVEKHFKLKDIITTFRNEFYDTSVEKHFKLKDITTSYRRI